MKRHMKSKHDDDGGRILKIGCEKCERMDEHENCGEGKMKESKYKCNECDKGFRNHEAFKSQKLRREHYKQMHPGVKIFMCGECNYGANYLPNLNSHINSKHKKKVLQCPKCPYTTTWNQSFHAHMRTNHGIFQKNSKYFTDGKTFLCEGCDLSTFSKVLYEAHKAALNCEVAPKTITNEWHLRKRRKLSGYNKEPKNYSEQKLKKFKCDQCNYSTDYAANVRLHIQVVHEKNKPFKCKELGCKFETGTKQNLQVHENSVHRGIRFSCHVCGYESPSASYIKIHKELKHENK